MRTVIGVVVAAGLSALLAGCGEEPTNVTLYKQGKYQGKPDNVPWQGAAFNNNQAEWERTIKARTTAQNEYVRIGTQ